MTKYKVNPYKAVWNSNKIVIAVLLAIVFSGCSSNINEEANMNTEIYENLSLSETSGVPEFGLSAPISVMELVVIDINEGKGASVKIEDTLEVNYLGVGGTTGFAFDSSFTRSQTATFPLQAVIAGWQEGLLGMREGGRRVLLIPGTKGYGPTPPPGSGIVENETLIFLVDLIAIR